MNLAPNGKPSNLTPEQYKLVRTKAFKKWFGDWENDPKNASKVVDENGEPLLLYRGNKGNVEELGYEFNLGQNLLNKKSNNNFGFFFTDDIKVAKSYGNPLWNFKYDTALYYVLNVFIDVKNIIDLRSLGFRTIGIDFIELLDKKNISFKGYENLKQEIIKYDRTYDTIDAKEWYTPNVYDFFDVFPKLREVFKNNKINGVLFKEKSRTSKGEITYAVFNSNQIKLADGTNIKFDGSNPDIRFDKGGLIKIQPIQNELAHNYFKRNDAYGQFIAKNGNLFYIVMDISPYPKVRVFDAKTVHKNLGNGYGTNNIAIANFNVDYPNKTFSGYSENQSIFVENDYRRIGIASAITDFAEEVLGMNYVPSKLLSNEMQGFVNNRFNYEKYGGKNPDIRFDEGGLVEYYRGYQIEIKNEYEYIVTALKNGKRVGLLTFLRNPYTSKNGELYILVDRIDINEKERGYGLATKMYQYALKHLHKKYKGIASDLKNRVNKNEIPKIYSKFNNKIESWGGVEYHLIINPDIRFDKGGLVGDLFTKKVYIIRLSGGDWFEDYNSVYDKYEDALNDYNKINNSDFERYENSKGLVKTLSEKTLKYKFVAEIDEDDNIDDYTDTITLKNETFWQIIDDGEWNDLEADSVERVNEKADKLLSEVYNYYGRKYNTIYLNEDETISLKLRIADHSGKWKNKGSEDYFLSIVISDKNPTEDFYMNSSEGLNREEEEVFSSENTFEEIIEFINEKIEYYKEKSNILFDDGGKIPKELYHYTSEKNFDRIFDSNILNPSQKYGNRLSFTSDSEYHKKEHGLDYGNTNVRITFDNEKLISDGYSFSPFDHSSKQNKIGKEFEYIISTPIKNVKNYIKNITIFKGNAIVGEIDKTATDYANKYYLNSDIRYADGGLINKKFYHSSDENLSLEKILFYSDEEDYRGNSFYITDDIDYSKNFGQNLYEVTLSKFNELKESKKNIKAISNYFNLDYEDFDSVMDVLQYLNDNYKKEKVRIGLVNLGFDGLIEKNKYYTQISLWNKKAIKSLTPEHNPDIRYADGGLLAPNGKQSNLTAEQYKLVRTKAFKNWFGDWENDSANASKVVDSNGEPLVLWHGSKFLFNEFKLIQTEEAGFHFGTLGQAEFRIKSSKEKYFYQCFLNIRNVVKTTDMVFFSKHKVSLNLSEIGIFTREDYMNWSKFYNIIKEKNIDGLKYENSYEGIGYSYMVFSPNQIKLADGTNTTFDSNNNDIRFDNGGSVSELKNYLHNIRLDEYFMENEIMDDDDIEQYKADFGRKGKITYRVYPDKKGDVNSSIYIYSIDRGTFDYGEVQSIEGKKDSRGEGAKAIASLFLLYPNINSVHYLDESYFDNESKSFWQKIGGSSDELLRSNFFNYYKTKFGNNPDIRYDEGGNVKYLKGKKTKIFKILQNNELTRDEADSELWNFNGNYSQLNIFEEGDRADEVEIKALDKEGYFDIDVFEKQISEIILKNKLVDKIELEYGDNEGFNTNWLTLYELKGKYADGGEVKSDYIKRVKEAIKYVENSPNARMQIDFEDEEGSKQAINEGKDYERIFPLKSKSNSFIVKKIREGVQDKYDSIGIWNENKKSDDYKYPKNKKYGDKSKEFDTLQIANYDEKGKIVGIIKIATSENKKQDVKKGAFKISVRQDYQNKGIASKLIEKAESEGIDFVEALKNNNFTSKGRWYFKSWLNKKLKNKVKYKYSEGGMPKKEIFNSIGSAIGFGTIPMIEGHDMVAECDCGEKFTYQNSKKDILWQCPKCNVKKGF